MTRYNLNDRPVPSGSMVPQFNPKIDPRLNVKLGPSEWPSPLVKQTSSGGALRETAVTRRRAAIALPPRFDRS